MSGTLYVPLKADYYEDPKIIRAGEQAELLYVHMLAYCSRTFSDGFVDDTQMTRLGLKRVEKRAATLAQLALITRVDDADDHGYRVTSWLKHNASVAEIAKARESESHAGKRGNHLRWHVQKNVKIPGCEWCNEDSEGDRVPNRGPDAKPDDDLSGDPIAPISLDTDTDTDTTTVLASASSSATATPPDPVSKGLPAACGAFVFADFWSVYPRHEAMPPVRKAWNAALKRATSDKILAGAQRYRDDPNRDPGFTKTGENWLEQDGWEDDPLPARKTQRGRDPNVERETAARVLDAVAAQKMSQQPQSSLRSGTQPELPTRGRDYG